MIHNMASDDGEQYLYVRDFAGLNPQQVPVEDDQIGEFADFERADIPLYVQLVGGVCCYGPYHGWHCQADVGTQSTCIFWPRGGVVLAGHANFQSEPLVETVDRPVAAVSDPCACRGEVAGGLHVFEASGTHVVLGAVEGVWARLLPLERQHRNHAQLGVTREVGGDHDLVVREGGTDVTFGKLLA